MSVRQKQIFRALAIKRTLGHWVAARYLYLRGWSLDAAVWLLLGKEVRS